MSLEQTYDLGPENRPTQLIREHEQIRATLAEQQWVQFKMAELKTEVKCLRALVCRACDLSVTA